MKPAEKIIALFGGIRPMATAMKLPPSTVQRWKLSGFIPSRRQGEVLAAAKVQGIELSPSDFFPPAEAA